MVLSSITRIHMPFCSNCGLQLTDTSKFCANCGTAVQIQIQKSTPSQTVQSVPSAPPQPQIIREPEEEPEISYYSGEGELIVKRTEHRGAGRKIASTVALGPVGYVLFGRDKTRKSKAEGTIVITNKAIYCAGNDYPFDRIISITKEGRISKSIVITFEKDFGAGGRADGGHFGVGGISIEIEIKTKDIDGMFRGLERAKMSRIKGVDFRGSDTNLTPKF
jgi:hypothetical protein